MKYHRDELRFDRYIGITLSAAVLVFTLNDLGDDYPGWDHLFEKAVYTSWFERVFDLTGNLDAPL
ncbi:MAG: hypothetical protein RKR03_09100 [Candidatus Competibacter sp.]|nr:hypothetical protein [Candidatus Competibacter sp.]MDS4060536.1 hypothetical protein [Candidatus Contendobacter sp.]